MRYDIDVFHYFSIYKREWKKMIFLIVVVGVAAAVIGFVQPTIYRSTAIALSSKEGGGQSLNFGGGILGVSNVFVSNSSDDIIFSILKSRRTSIDINEHFRLKDRPGFWWVLDTYIVTGGFAVEAKSTNPEMSKDIVNFAIENLDKINQELQITPNKPMIKVLDYAVKGVSVKKEVSKKIIASVLLAFLIHALFIFFREYFCQLKTFRKITK